MSNPGAASGSNNSMFAQTCKLLSDYVKEKGPLRTDHFTLAQETIPADQKLGLTRDVSLMDFSTKEEASQMTIFYGGKVTVLNVFDSKAEEIMRLASKASSSVPAAAPAAVPHPDTKLTSMDLSIKRKTSLSLFLEKRKNRINAREPYSIKGEEYAKSADKQPWLELAAPSLNNSQT